MNSNSNTVAEYSMGSDDDRSSNCQAGELMEENGNQKIYVSDNKQSSSTAKSGSFVVEMEPFSNIADKEIKANSRITLQRNLSRKGFLRGGEMKINSIPSLNERDTNMLIATSPIATFTGGSMPEKPLVVAVGTTDHSLIPQTHHHHHQITITNSSMNNTAAESKSGGRRFSFRRTLGKSFSFRRTHSWTMDPRRILLFFATLSSMGTILLIYFTLSMAKLSGDDNPVNQ